MCIIFYNNYLENGTYPHLFLFGNNSEAYDNHFWGSGGTLGEIMTTTATNIGCGLLLGNLCGETRIENNSYDYCLYGIVFTLGTMKTIDKNSLFGEEYANTYDYFIHRGSGVVDYTFDSDSDIIEESTNAFILPGESKIRLIDYSGIATNDKGIYRYGKTQRCNASLADTTVHTTGGESVRFEPNYSPYALSVPFDIQIGDCKDKQMNIGVWCKINNAAYYSGTKQLPRLTITYDNGTEAYAEATDTTDWQLLTFSFKPTTSYGTITATITGATDATGTDRYFYIADMFILYPVSFKVSWGDIITFASGFPYMPYMRKRLNVDINDLIFYQ